MEEHKEIEPESLPRWITIPLGLILIPFTFLCVIGSSVILLAPNIPRSFLTVLLGSLFLAGSLWVFYLSFRLVFVNPKGKSKFIPPIGLRIIAVVFAAIPLISLILGSFWEKPIIHSIMAIAYIGIVIKFWSLANHRKYHS